MLKSSKVIAFVPTKNFKKAKAFYEGCLGLKLISEDDFALVFTAKGVTLRVAMVGAFTPASFTILGWEVKGIKKVVSSLRKKGVKFARYPGMGQDKLGIWDSPSGAKVAWFKDGDGNTLSVTEY